MNCWRKFFRPGRPVDSRNSHWKTINYRGGIVRFRIPSDWVEEYDDFDGGTFYSRRDDSGTLRVSVITASAPANEVLTSKSAMDWIRDRANAHGSPIRVLREGVAMTCHDSNSEEAGHQITIRFWEIAQALPPDNLRIVVFSYTLLAQQATQLEFQAELDSLDREFVCAEFAPVVGECVPYAKSSD